MYSNWIMCFMRHGVCFISCTKICISWLYLSYKRLKEDCTVTSVGVYFNLIGGRWNWGNGGHLCVVKEKQTLCRAALSMLMWVAMREKESSTAPYLQVSFSQKPPLEAHTDPLCRLNLWYNDALDFLKRFPKCSAHFYRLWCSVNLTTIDG